jgi:glycosyltransferase involved in cell wall biosynthesis
MSHTFSPDISIVIPVLDEQECIPATHARLEQVLEGLDLSWEIVFVDDGSTDASWERIAALARGGESTRGVRLSRNFGHQYALLAGLHRARGRAVVVMDADLQHPPEMIAEMVRHWREGFLHVYTVREETEGSSWLKDATSRLFYRLVNALSRTHMVPGAADFRLLDRKVVEIICSLPESQVFLRGLLSWIGCRSIGLPYRAERRFAGRSKYNLGRMLRFALDGITSFSVVPLRLATVAGLGITLLSLAYLVYVLYVHFWVKDAVPGWSSILVSVLFVGGMQMLMLGLIGEYLGKTFIETKRRPGFIIVDEAGDSDHVNSADTP